MGRPDNEPVFPQIPLISISNHSPAFVRCASFEEPESQKKEIGNLAAKKWNTFISTGEGGYPDTLIEHKDNIITQVATGMFGVSEETIKYAPIVEFKYAQGAKPGLGGHLLGDKATTSVAELRESVPWISLFSPFPFHSVYSV